MLFGLFKLKTFKIKLIWTILLNKSMQFRLINKINFLLDLRFFEINAVCFGIITLRVKLRFETIWFNQHNNFAILTNKQKHYKLYNIVNLIIKVFVI